MRPNQNFTVGQKAFIDKDGKLLIVIDPRHGLDLPGGRLQEGETDLKMSMEREIEEETKLKIKIGRPLTAWIWDKYKKPEKPPVFLVGYQCQYISGEMTLSNEHSQYFWVTKEDHKEVLKQWWDESNATCLAIKKYFE